MAVRSLFGCLLLLGTTCGQPPGGSPTADPPLWLKADAGTSRGSNGCAVTRWTDPGPNGNVATGFYSPTLPQGLHNFDAGIPFNTAPSTASTNRYFDVTDGFDNFTAGISLRGGATDRERQLGAVFDFSAGVVNTNSKSLFGRRGERGPLARPAFRPGDEAVRHLLRTGLRVG